MSNATMLDKPSEMDDAAIAELFNLDARHDTVATAPQGFSKSGNCTDDGCTRTCNCVD